MYNCAWQIVETHDIDDECVTQCKQNVCLINRISFFECPFVELFWDLLSDYRVPIVFFIGGHNRGQVQSERLVWNRSEWFVQWINFMSFVLATFTSINETN